MIIIYLVIMYPLRTEVLLAGVPESWNVIWIKNNCLLHCHSITGLHILSIISKYVQFIEINENKLGSWIIVSCGVYIFTIQSNHSKHTSDHPIMSHTSNIRMFLTLPVTVIATIFLITLLSGLTFNLVSQICFAITK